MTSKTIAPFGSWLSPIDSRLVTADSVHLDELQLHASGCYWVERRPDEQGRCVIVRSVNGKNIDLIPTPFSARSRVHEYGGGVYCIASNGIYFVNDKDQNIYFCAQGESPAAITDTSDCCYADLQLDQARNRLICVQQRSAEDLAEDENSLISIDLETHTVSSLNSGYDFYASPRLSPNGNQLSWLCWNHPDMPWDRTTLWLADIDENHQLHNITALTHPESDQTSIFQPQWSGNNILYFVSDLTGWWNLYRYQGQTIQAVSHEALEFGLPQWVFAQSSYAFINDIRILCAPIDRGIASLAILNTTDSTLEVLDTEWNSFASIQANAEHFSFIAASSKNFAEVISYQSGQHRIIKSSYNARLDEGYYSFGKSIQFTGRHGDTVYGIYYPPSNKDFQATGDETPPLIVLSHGGPTAMADPSLDMRKQYWTSRGFALLDVNYSGSTGFGREYRERLNGNWGNRDAEDCCDAALHLVLAFFTCAGL
ncbi:MAG: prolyl oligopeptidase family serine peptidase, partial [Gammaproteobacteria bacterium]|nr:prolyl oligopeptidase family serine peptidase [Gammaproteobacteria bacterium]